MSRGRIIVGLGGLVVLAVGGCFYASAKDFVALLYYARENPYNEAQFDKVVADIGNGSLAPDAHGIVSLPPAFAALTKDGRAYVTRHADGSISVLLLTWRGKSINLRGYLHTAASLTIPGTVQVTIPLPDIQEPIIEADVIVQARVGRNWYRVSGENLE